MVEWDKTFIFALQKPLHNKMKRYIEGFPLIFMLNKMGCSMVYNTYYELHTMLLLSICNFISIPLSTIESR